MPVVLVGLLFTSDHSSSFFELDVGSKCLNTVKSPGPTSAQISRSLGLVWSQTAVGPSYGDFILCLLLLCYLLASIEGNSGMIECSCYGNGKHPVQKKVLF